MPIILTAIVKTKKKILTDYSHHKNKKKSQLPPE